MKSEKGSAMLMVILAMLLVTLSLALATRGLMGQVRVARRGIAYSNALIAARSAALCRHQIPDSVDRVTVGKIIIVLKSDSVIARGDSVEVEVRSVR